MTLQPKAMNFSGNSSFREAHRSGRAQVAIQLCWTHQDRCSPTSMAVMTRYHVATHFKSAIILPRPPAASAP
jgi:hypothetical protein